jgi:hypothetical protein
MPRELKKQRGIFQRPKGPGSGGFATRAMMAKSTEKKWGKQHECMD